MMRLATDVGGTFTDLVAYDDATGALYTAKSLTTTHDQSIGVLDAISLSESHGLPMQQVGFFVHGGTTVINAITERKGVRTALVTTAGFRDVLEIGRGNRPDLYNLRSSTPPPIVPRHLRFEVRERCDARGRILRALEEKDVIACALHCREEGVEAVGIVFLHSYANPDHERRCAAILREMLPNVTVSASYEISRHWREFERSNTVAMNAYVQPIIRRYFGNLENALRKKGLRGPFYAMQSNGGIATFPKAVEAPLTLIESGPSGGVAGAVCIGSVIGETEVLYLDVGGTTAKCSLIRAGNPKLDVEYKLERTRLSPGYTVQIPVIDIVEVGAGGGSIAKIDAAGRLRVGPQSAGSLPGPACYGRGGTEATLTDAKVVVGIFDPANFADGRLVLHPKLAKKAIAKIGEALGMSVEQAAEAIIKIAEENMINALKLVTIRRGYDPRDLTLIVSGGAGPMVAASLGRELHAAKIVIPLYPGIFSAWGMLAARPRVDLRQTIYLKAIQASLTEIDRLFAKLEKEAAAELGRSDHARTDFKYAVEMRYVGQEHSVPVPYNPRSTLEELMTSFHTAHQRAFSFCLPEAKAELTAIHLQAKAMEAVLQPTEVPDPKVHPHVIKRSVYFGADLGWQRCPVYQRTTLPICQVFAGPALIEEPTATTLILPEQTFHRDRTGQLIVIDQRNDVHMEKSKEILDQRAAKRDTRKGHTE